MIKSLVLRFVPVLLCLLLVNSAYSQLKQYKKLEPDSINDFSDFEMLEAVLQDKQIILTGENHNFRNENLPFSFKFFKYLHEKYDVNTFVMEFGLGVEWLITQYVYEGDTVARDLMKKSYFPQQFGLVDSLRSYYLTQKDTNPFKIKCVDIDRNWGSTFNALEALLPKKSAPDSLVMIIESIAALQDQYNQWGLQDYQTMNLTYYRGYNYMDYYRSATLLFQDYDSLKSGITAYLGDLAPDFHNIMEGLRKGLKWNVEMGNQTVQHSIYREQQMYQTMINYLKDNPGEKVFGQFGRCHVQDSSKIDQCYFESFRSFAQRLDESGSVNLKGKVFQLPFIYHQIYTYGSSYAVQYPFQQPGSRDKSLADAYFKGVDISKKGLYLAQLDELKKDTTTKRILDYQPEGIPYEYAIFNFQTPSSYFNQRKTTTLGTGTDFYSYYHFQGGIQFTGFNFGELNSALAKYGLEPYDGLTMGYSVAFRGYEPTFFYGGFSYNWWKKEPKGNDSLTLDLSGYSILGHAGYPTIDNKHFQVALFYNFGWARMKLEETLNDPIPIVNDPTILASSGSDNVNIYTNPAVILGAGVDARVKFFPFSVFVQGGYNFDLSLKRWLPYADAQIKTSYRSYYATAGVSLYLGSNW